MPFTCGCRKCKEVAQQEARKRLWGGGFGLSWPLAW
jgi:hypothetical protein